MVDFFNKRIEQIEENGMQIVDIPIIALLIFAALVVVCGEIGCVIWFLAIIVQAISDGVSKLLLLIPCTILTSIFTSIIVFVMSKMDL